MTTGFRDELTGALIYSANDNLGAPPAHPETRLISSYLQPAPAPPEPSHRSFTPIAIA